MTRLLLAEFDRLRSRRIALFALLFVVLAIAAFQFSVRSQAAPPPATEVASGQAQFQEDLRQWQQNHERVEQECLAQPGATAQDCAGIWPEPKLQDYVRTPQSFAEVAPISTTLSAYLIGLAGFFVAASYVGAEFTSGSIANWLTFVPDRWRVFGSKLIVMVAASAVVGAVVTALGLVATAVIAQAYGASMSGVGPVVAAAGRAVLIVVVLTVIGFCAALLLRNTAAALGVLIGYYVVYLARTILGNFSPWIAEATRWFPDANLSAVLNKGYTFDVARRLPDGDFDTVQRTVGLAAGLGYWAVVLAVLIALTGLVFRRRDVN